MQRAIERVRGFHDVDPVTFRRLNLAVQRLQESFRLSGYAMIDVPVVEQLELYLRKNGAQVLTKLYGFTDQGRREVALRPEFTASVIRALAPRAGTAGEPIRIAYTGPVFRYEKPQRATARQFTQAGVELLGDGSPAADAEIIALACRSARTAGVHRLRLVLGHLGPLRALLTHLQVDGYAEGYLLEHLEFYNRGEQQQQAVRRRLGLQETVDGVPAEALPESLAAAVRDASPEEAREMVSAILDQMGFSLSGSTRAPDEIIDRVLSKAQRQADLRSGTRRDNLERALAFTERLGPLRGTPETVLPRAEELLAQFGVPLDALDELRDVLRLLDQHSLEGVTIEVAPGMARGIAYYSGMIFELYADDDLADLQICGGGRYDGLARALTGRHSFPALGFAFGVERLLHALATEAVQVPVEPRLIILVADVTRRGEAQRLATALRQMGTVTVVAEIAQPPARAIEQAGKAGYAAAVVLPPSAPSSTPLEIHALSAMGEGLRARVDAALLALSATSMAEKSRI